jgi:hypothetical protein
VLDAGCGIGRPLPAGAGWRLDRDTDEDERFLAIAVRTGRTG